MMDKIAPDLNERVPEGWSVVPLRWYLTCKSGEFIDNQLIEKESSEDKYTPVIGGNGIMGYSNKVNITNETLSIGRVGALCGNVHYINYPCWITDNSLLISRYERSKMDLEFLKLILEQLNLNQYSTSTAQPLITGETIKKRKIALPSIKVQKRIVAYVNKKVKELDLVINCKSKIIELLEEKRQAMITEAVTKGLNPNVKMKDSDVEWIGEIPEHWTISKIKYQAFINKYTLNENTAEDLVIEYIDIGSVNSKGEIEQIVKYVFSEAPSRARRILHKGDTIISTVRTYLKAIASIEEEQENLICSTGFAVLTPKASINEKFLSYLFKTTYYIDEIVSRSTGVSYPAINASEIGNFECILPSLDEQENIVSYLNESLKEIDKVTLEIKIQIQKLKEYRQSLIYEAVTGKIDLHDFEVEQ